MIYKFADMLSYSSAVFFNLVLSFMIMDIVNIIDMLDLQFADMLTVVQVFLDICELHFIEIMSSRKT